MKIRKVNYWFMKKNHKYVGKYKMNFVKRLGEVGYAKALLLYGNGVNVLKRMFNIQG